MPVHFWIIHSGSEKMYNVGRQIGRLCCSKHALPRFIIIRGTCVEQKLSASKLCEKDCDRLTGTQRLETVSCPTQSAGALVYFNHLSQARTPDQEQLPDLSLVKAMLQDELTALSFEDLGKSSSCCHNIKIALPAFWRLRNAFS